ncbi:MAG: flagellar biosynthesis protein FlhF [Candidatus Gastranaerophilales bacterium]|nr:flagellar biosynthesis protein FlhF [Candidatus Gastranaerophilales bacterium]
MIIKKFLGKNEAEAVAAAKKELGEGVVIMNVREVKQKGLTAIFHGKLTEVTAALEEEKEPVKPVKRELPQAGTAVLPQIQKEPQPEQAPTVSDLAKAGISLDPQKIERKLDNLQNLLESQLKKEDEPAGAGVSKGENGADKSEKAKEDVEQPELTELDKFLRLLYNTMLENEVDEKYANQIMEDADKNKKPNIPFDYILANIYQKMVLKFGKSEGIKPAAKGPKAVFFLGPTGVGKTTTIAKVASSFAMEEKKKVALITTDTYRIAAAEQLRTYANILEVPFRVVYTEEELGEAFTSFKDYDYIFVDTAGHSPKSEEQLEKMQSLLKAAEGRVEYQVFLVLSATTKYKDLLKTAESYRSVTDYELIFTKLDETTTWGSILNLKLYTDTTIAYVTSGQNVPNDIEVFNPQRTVKQLLGGKS